MAVKLNIAQMQGFSILRITSSMFLLMFTSQTRCDEVMNSRILQNCFSRVELWSSSIEYKSRRVWLSINGLPIQSWSLNSFNSIASVWGSFVRVGEKTSAPSSFERCRISIETDNRVHIDDIINFHVEGVSYPIRVLEVDMCGPALECECVTSDDSNSSSEADSEHHEGEESLRDRSCSSQEGVKRFRDQQQQLVTRESPI
ncbi:hypothetical protein HRI_000651700 [Hibiscus trionum]|uniref:DUF4283 domain-containing protein n=1 Tax=Hibiscus trionum TaxID=183268 RepID=A0A9W7H2D1_HIBTR|nr:hypothetical protein HRI_000651700 [Hibiscus trionum]